MTFALRHGARRALLVITLPLLGVTVAAQGDSSQHTSRQIVVEAGVQLEVLDWGGTGATAMLAGQRRFDTISGPVLAIYALPHDLGPTASAAARERDHVRTAAQADAFEKGVPNARVVRIPNASHYVFRSHGADVVRELKAFIGTLPR